jgi:hypothetical protein
MAHERIDGARTFEKPRPGRETKLAVRRKHISPFEGKQISPFERCCGVYVYMHTHTRVCVCVCVCVCVYVCAYAYVYVYVYICIYIYKSEDLPRAHTHARTCAAPDKTHGREKKGAGGGTKTGKLVLKHACVYEYVHVCVHIYIYI